MNEQPLTEDEIARIEESAQARFNLLDEGIVADVHRLIAALRRARAELDFERKKLALSEKNYRLLVELLESSKVETALNDMAQSMSRIVTDLHGIRRRLDFPPDEPLTPPGSTQAMAQAVDAEIIGSAGTFHVGQQVRVKASAGESPVMTVITLFDDKEGVQCLLVSSERFDVNGAAFQMHGPVELFEAVD